MLSTVISASSTPFSVRDILSAAEQSGSMDHCYQSQDMQIGNHLQQQQTDYYGYAGMMTDNGWDMEKLKEQAQQSVNAYQQGYGELNPVHQLSQVVPPYQDSQQVEDGELNFIEGFRKISENLEKNLV